MLNHVKGQSHQGNTTEASMQGGEIVTEAIQQILNGKNHSRNETCKDRRHEIHHFACTA